uniref:Uncharacterized protein n=1 Tax=Eutreptiella gymnastica TaxID=73025 RepID=A0A6U8B8Y2_9EUGL|mmetsp:Transcript_1766/g.3454  ORF Transcript_1766/g.3454 Transcript_1766/m.3454 type:complete len:160 (+) Transcript_1766:455-934(+)
MLTALGFKQEDWGVCAQQSLQMFIPDVFPQGVPHMKLQRLVKVTDTSLLIRIFTRLWMGAGLVIKKMDPDKRVRFGGESRGRHLAVNPFPQLSEKQAYFTTPANMLAEDVRKMSMLFIGFSGAAHTVYGRSAMEALLDLACNNSGKGVQDAMPQMGSPM